MTAGIDGPVRWLAVVVALAAGTVCAQPLSDEEALGKARAVLAQMTLEEKASLAGGNGTMTLNAIPRVGILREWTMSDSSHTVRQDLSHDDFSPVRKTGDESTMLPTLSALASTWNVALAERYGHVLGEEARERGKDQMLGPGVNLMRTPLCGRNWEYLSEDPVLAAKLVVPEIRAMQSHDVAACVKHFALNSQEDGRHGNNAIVDERTLNELYLPAFRAAVKEGGALTLMTAYNSYNGERMSENAYLLRGVLRDRWGFLGAIVSDWGGQVSCERAARNGCGIEMNDGLSIRHLRNNRKGTLPVAEAVKGGLVPAATLDEMTLRILYVMAKTRFFDEANRAPGSRNTPEHFKTALEVAEEAVTLLKNDGGVLPLEAKRIKRLVLVGRLADEMHRGGSSAQSKPLYEITPARGLEEYFAARRLPVELIRLPITEAETWTNLHPLARAPWTAEYFSDPAMTRTLEVFERAPLRTAELQDLDVCYWSYPIKELDLPKESDYYVRYSARLVAPESGRYVFEIRNSALGFEKTDLFIDGQEVVPWGDRTVSRFGTIVLEKGRTYAFRVRHFARNSPAKFATIRLGLRWRLPSEAPADDFDAKLRSADAVLVFTGTSLGEGVARESEGRDRPNMAQRPGVDETVSRILSLGLGNVVVVNHSGSPIELNWADAAKAVVQMPYLGQEAGRALANVLFGDVNPSGRLPCTWPKRYADTGVGTLGTCTVPVSSYNERFYVGYRWHDRRGIAPRYPFGHGLSYTTFAYGAPRAEPLGADAWKVSVPVTNTGRRTGSETVQFYAAWPEATVERCVKELKGFDKVSLAPGETKVASAVVTARDLAYWDDFTHRFRTEAGPVEILAGASSADIRGRVRIAVGLRVFAD